MGVHDRELEDELIHEAIWGEGNSARRALACVYDHYEPRVRHAVGWTAHRAGHVQAIDELRQEVWLRLLSRDRRLLRYFRRERGRFGPFLSLLARQQALAAIQVDRRQMVSGRDRVDYDQELEDERASDYAAKLIQSELFSKIMARADLELDDLDRRILQEIHLEQGSCRRLASQLGLEESALYKRNERLKKKLKTWARELTSPGDDPRPPQLRPALLVVLLALSGDLSNDPRTGQSLATPAVVINV